MLLYPKKGSNPSSSEMQEMEKFIAAYDGKEAEMEELTERIEMYKRKKEKLQEALYGT